MIKSVIKKIPKLGRLANEYARGGATRKQGGKNSQKYVFERLELDSAPDASERVRRQLLNLLNYTKTSGSSYSARLYPAGYHTLSLDDIKVQGQRDPLARLRAVPVDFTGKTVLDIGSNQGGMLFALKGLRWGVGIDFDSRMVNVANRISVARNSHEMRFYVFDLEKEPLELIRDFLPEAKVDVVFLLSVCMWLKNWREVIDYAARISSAMLFETNGTDQQQQDQEEHLGCVYSSVITLANASDDDPKQKRRRLLYCTEPRSVQGQTLGG